MKTPLIEATKDKKFIHIESYYYENMELGLVKISAESFWQHVKGNELEIFDSNFGENLKRKIPK